MSNEFIVQRRIKHQKLLRKARRIENAILHLYKILRLCAVIFIIYLAVKFANSSIWMLPDDIYTNKNTDALEIIGNNIVKSDLIIAEMKKVPIEKKPIFLINPSKITKSIEKLQPIRRVYVRRFWNPVRLVVMIEEYNPVITIAPSETAADAAAFDLTGHIIQKNYLPLNSSFNTTKVLASTTNGDDYNKWDKTKVELLYKLSKTVEGYAGEKIKYIDLRQPNNVFIQLQSVKVRIGELDSGVFDRIKAIYDILPRVKQMKEKVKYIDLSWRDSRYLKLERPKPEIKPEVQDKTKEEQTPQSKPEEVKDNTQIKNIETNENNNLLN